MREQNKEGAKARLLLAFQNVAADKVLCNGNKTHCTSAGPLCVTLTREAKANKTVLLMVIKRHL